MPYTPDRIKHLLYGKTGQSLSALASEWQVRLEELSMCIRQVPRRIYPELRLRVSAVIGEPVEVVFGKHPLTTALSLNKSTKRRRAA